MIDPGFYDWGDTGDYGNAQGDTTANYAPYSNYGEPYPQDQQQPYNAQPPDPESAPPQPPYQPGSTPRAARPPYSGSTSSNALSPEQPLTLIFKDNRAPKKVRNYMMTTKELTDMDPQHFERIPLDEIDIAATARLNRDHGVDFKVPGPIQN